MEDNKTMQDYLFDFAYGEALRDAINQQSFKGEKNYEYCGAAEPPARWWRSHLSGLLEPPRLSTGYLAFSGSNP